MCMPKKGLKGKELEKQLRSHARANIIMFVLAVWIFACVVAILH